MVIPLRTVQLCDSCRDALSSPCWSLSAGQAVWFPWLSPDCATEWVEVPHRVGREASSSLRALSPLTSEF